MLPGITPFLAPSQRVYTFVPAATGTIISDLTNNAAAFDGVTSAAAPGSVATIATSTSGYVNYVGKNWAATKSIAGFDLYGPNNSNPFGGGGALAFKLQGSDGVTWFDLYTGSLATGSNSILSVNSGLPDVYYISHRVICNGNGVNSIFIAELNLYELA